MSRIERRKTRKTAGEGPKVVRRRIRLDPTIRSKMIIDAAFNAIATGGFERLRTRDIAELVGINSATLHHYFPTKEDLVAAVAKELERRFRTEKSQPAPKESPIDALGRQARDAICYSRDRPEMLAVYRELVARAPRDTSIRKLVQHLHDGWRADIVEALAKGRGDGSFRPNLDIDAAAGIILSTIWGLVTHIFSSKEDLDKAFHELTRWLLAEQKPPMGPKSEFSNKLT